VIHPLLILWQFRQHVRVVVAMCVSSQIFACLFGNLKNAPNDKEYFGHLQFESMGSGF
jgi:hypothetical protein